MKFSYRTEQKARTIAELRGRPLDNRESYKINALSDDEVELYIFGEIGWPFSDAEELIKTINGIKSKSILLRINSPGGDVFDGTAVFNALANHPAKVTTRIEGLAASMGSAIAMAGKEVQAYSNTMVMVHDPWIMAIGSHTELREIADIVEKISENLLDIYIGKTKTGKKEMKAMMAAETWMTAADAKDKGFVDTILTSGKAAKAQFDLSIFNHVPEQLYVQNNKAFDQEFDWGTKYAAKKVLEILETK